MSRRSHLWRLFAPAAVALLSFASAAPARPSAPPTLLQSLEVKSPSLAFAVGDAAIAGTIDGGRSWRTYSVPAVGGIAGASFLSASQWWVAGTSVGPASGFGRVPILYTTDAGTTWHRALLSRRYPDGHGFVAFAFANRRDGWLTVDTVHNSNFAKVDLYRTSDGGASWHYLANRRFSGPIRFVGGRVWATTGPSSGGLVSSDDLGRTWQSVSLPTPRSLRGETRAVTLPQSIGHSSSDLALGTMYYGKPSAGDVNTVLVYVSGDGGRHWRATRPITDRRFWNVGVGAVPPTAFADREQWLVADNSTLFTSNDAGRTWRRAKAALRGSRVPLWLSSIAFPTVRLGFGLIQYAHCREFKRDCTQRSFVVRTADGGRHWALLTVNHGGDTVSPCRLSQLSLTPVRLRVSEATEYNTLLFEMTNRARESCLLRGHPTIALIDSRAAVLPFVIRREVGPARPPGVVLRSGDAGYFALRKLTCVLGDRGRARTLLLAMPAENSHVTLSVAMPAWRDFSYCDRRDRGSVVRVSAFVSGIAVALRQR